MAKRGICSYDVMPVPERPFLVTDAKGDMFFCGVRCLALWALQRVTHPQVKPEQVSGPFVVTEPAGKRVRFEELLDLAKWAVANLLAPGAGEWVKLGVIERD